MMNRMPSNQIDYVNCVSSFWPNNIHNMQQNHRIVCKRKTSSINIAPFFSYSSVVYFYFAISHKTIPSQFADEHWEQAQKKYQIVSQKINWNIFACWAIFIDIDQLRFKKPYQMIRANFMRKKLREKLCKKNYRWENDLLQQRWCHHKVEFLLLAPGDVKMCNLFETRLEIYKRVIARDVHIKVAGRLMQLILSDLQLSIHLSTRQRSLINVQIEFMHLILRLSSCEAHLKWIEIKRKRTQTSHTDRTFYR